MIDTFIVDGVSLATYGVYWDGSQLFDKPRKDVVFYSVPGRNGDLFRNNDRFENISINVNCYIKSNFRQNFDQLMNFLYSREGYVKLANSKDPDVYRMGQFVDAVKPSPGQFLRNAQFTLVFNCMPQRFYETESTMSVNATTRNETKVTDIFLASDSAVLSIMRSVPEEFRSNAQAFYAFAPPTDYGTGGMTATNVEMAWSVNDKEPMYVYWDEDRHAYYYTMGNVTGVSFTVPAISGESVPPTGYILTPMQLDGYLTASGRYNGSNYSWTSVDFSTKISEISETNALGATINLNAQLHWTSGLYNGEVIMLSAANGNDEKGRMYIKCQSPSSDIRNKLANYIETVSGYNCINVNIDLETLDVYAYKSGLPDLNLNSCFVITGDLGKNYNTLKCFYLANVSVLTCNVNARWWKL